jgi:RNA polymerase sigma-70 factor (ECF subfamily)
METEMTSSELPSAQQDESAVAAVRRGDAERYRELVERHQRRVYAVAWSRLGNAALAEEVTQEAFIRAYRRLWLLDDGAKFSGWVNTIARRVAINFGLRHRRELNKRESWALENPQVSTGETSAAETDALYTPETLRQTLAELPAAHRECLVLFYLEGKSGAEAAAALGISESALRVRLHRARGVLRERLEERLAESLVKLRPAKTLVPAIMAIVLTSSSAKAATAGGVGATVLSALAKFSPLKWFFAFIPLVTILPGLIFNWWFMRAERRNYRDSGGFRATLHRQFYQRALLYFPLMMLILLLLIFGTNHLFGKRELFLFLGLFLLVMTGFSTRQLQINRNRFQVVAFFSGFIMCIAFFSVGLGWFSINAFMPVVMLFSFLSILTRGSRPLRMDYNLFLRAAQGMLKPSELPPQKESSIRLDRTALRAFARFLGERQLVNNFHWEADGLVLRLPAVKSSFVRTWAGIFHSARCNSHIALGWDGSVAVHCEKNDAAGLATMQNNVTTDLMSLENQVTAVVAQAWRNFREGNTVLAERAIGQIPDTEIFVMPPARTAANRWTVIVFGGLVILMFALQGLQWLNPSWLSGLKPVNVTEAEVRAFLGNIRTNPNPILNHTRRTYPGDPIIALGSCLVLPSTNLFTANSLLAVHREVFRAAGFNPQGEVSGRLSAFEHAWLLHEAMAGGWIDWNDVGLTPNDLTQHFHNLKANEWQFMMGRRESRSWVNRERLTVERINDFTLNQLRWLRDVNCLDLIDRERLIEEIASVQTLSGDGQPPIRDWRHVRGLFFTPSWSALQDTYFSIAALEILGGLDKIDREACIQGILKRHSGKGYFTSPDNEYRIDGSARDTIAAFESLRILGALDRVKDLEKWQFRVASTRSSKPAANGVRTLTWEEVEAWVCQQRLEKILRERKENPQALVRSLLAP